MESHALPGIAVGVAKFHVPVNAQNEMQKALSFIVPNYVTRRMQTKKFNLEDLKQNRSYRFSS